MIKNVLFEDLPSIGNRNSSTVISCKMCGFNCNDGLPVNQWNQCVPTLVNKVVASNTTECSLESALEAIGKRNLFYFWKIQSNSMKCIFLKIAEFKFKTHTYIGCWNKILLLFLFFLKVTFLKILHLTCWIVSRIKFSLQFYLDCEKWKWAIVLN